MISGFIASLTDAFSYHDLWLHCFLQMRFPIMISGFIVSLTDAFSYHDLWLHCFSQMLFPIMISGFTVSHGEINIDKGYRQGAPEWLRMAPSVRSHLQRLAPHESSR